MPTSVRFLVFAVDGQLQYINYIGLPEFVQRADELAAKFGARFAPPQLLRDMAAKGETFQ